MPNKFIDVSKGCMEIAIEIPEIMAYMEEGKKLRVSQRMKKAVPYLEPCEDCGAPWEANTDGTPVQIHKADCWTNCEKGEPSREVDGHEI